MTYLSQVAIRCEINQASSKESRQLWTFDEPIFDQCSTYVKTWELVFISKMFEKQLWKSDILSKDGGHRPASLLKISLFQRCFSNILLVKTNYLVSRWVEHWS